MSRDSPIFQVRFFCSLTFSYLKLSGKVIKVEFVHICTYIYVHILLGNKPFYRPSSLIWNENNRLTLGISYEGEGLEEHVNEGRKEAVEPS